MTKTYSHNQGYLRVRNERGEIVLQHRDVMERKLGRKLLSNEIVHHKNEVKTDNEPSNLETLTRAEHTSLHQAPAARVDVECAHCGQTFEKEARRIKAQAKLGRNTHYCGRACKGKALRAAQLTP
jgi:hypothetical protein